MNQQTLGISANEAVERVDEYKFEPIQGYPMLQWRGKRPFRSTYYYPAQLKEVHGPEVEGWRNKIFWGDNLQVMSHLLKEFRGQVQLAYIDPPFDSGADYRRTINVRNNSIDNDMSPFEEKQYTDIWSNDEYLQFMYERLILIRELLSDTGNLYLHCDARRGAYLKVILDELFGPQNFVNEITWVRSLPHGNVSFGFGRSHDTILFYKKSVNAIWNKQFGPHREEYLTQFYRYDDGDGRRYRLISCINPNKDRPNLKYEWKGVTRVWKYSLERMKRMDAEGLLVYSSNGIPQYKGYLDQMSGVPIQDTWTDISPVMGSATEREDYPTQKPVALLKRIVAASSEPGDIVFDCFMGSGTTQTAALGLGRRFIGADINIGAVQVSTRRLAQAAGQLESTQPELIPIIAANEDDIDGDIDDEDTATVIQPSVYFTGFEVYNVNHYDVFRNPAQAKDLLVEALELEPLGPGQLFEGTRDGRMWKIMPVNRIATRADLNEIITGLDQRALQRRYEEHPNRPVEKITLVCMGHEPDLAASLKQELMPFEVDVEVVDILRDRQDLQFKRDAEARVTVSNGELCIEAFYPMNLLQKLSQQKEEVAEWRELVESVMVDWNYDGAVLQPAVVDVPDKSNLVIGRYTVPGDAGTIRVKITDLLSESWEGTVGHA